MTGVVLDAGALIALERNDRRLWAVLKQAAMDQVDVLVPSTALAQAWRGTKRQAMLARALEHCVIVGFDRLSRAVGELCGKANTADVCDAHVAIVATGADVLYTSDPSDMRRLFAAHGRARPAIIRC